MDNQFYIEINGQRVPVTEEVYRAYHRPVWAERKRQERWSRCRNENGFRCTKDCRPCEKFREGGVLSLDRFADDGYEIADQIDIAGLVEDRLQLELLLSALDDLEPDERSLIDALFHKNRTERDYAAEIGISHQAVGKRKRRIVEKLRRLLGAE